MGISASIASALTYVGVGAETAGVLAPALTTGLEGAAIGAGGAALTGGKPLKGAEVGGLAGLGAGFGPEIGGALGIGTTAGAGIGGALGGALGGAVTGGNVLQDAILGGAGGAGADYFGINDPASVNITPGAFGGVDAAGAGIGPMTGLDPATADAYGVPATVPGSPETLPSGPGGAAGPASAGGKGGLFGKDFTLRDALAGGGLALSAGRSQKLPGEAQLGTIAGQLGSQGKDLASYLQSGQLPPGVAAGLHQASESAKATIRSQYASMGMSNSSSAAQAEANVDLMAQTQGAQIAINLLNSGIQESQLSAELYNIILKNSLEQDQQLGSAISNFATAMASGNPQAKAA